MKTSLFGKGALALGLTSVFMISAVQADSPPPFAFEVSKDGAIDTTMTYSLTGPDTVEQLKVHGDGKPADIVIYDFTTEEAHYFQLHNHNRDVEMVPIAIKPFWDVDGETLAHARIEGCVAAMPYANAPDDMPHKDTAISYMKKHCPHM